jgi:ATP-dependent Clp protease adaptor protein ClpS
VVVNLRQVLPSLSEQDAIAVISRNPQHRRGPVIVCDIEAAEFFCETPKAKGSPA